MDIRKAFPSKYLGAADLLHLPSRSLRLTIAQLTTETLESREKGPEEKPILYFKGAKKGLVLNKTNSTKIGNTLGWDTDKWTGRMVELYVAEVEAFGETVEAIRVRVPVQPVTGDGIKRQTEMVQSEHDPLEPPPPDDSDVPF
jgi:hypothetical protein